MLFYNLLEIYSFICIVSETRKSNAISLSQIVFVDHAWIFIFDLPRLSFFSNMSFSCTNNVPDDFYADEGKAFLERVNLDLAQGR